MLRAAFLLSSCMLAACTSVPEPPERQEHRVLEAHEFYGQPSMEALLAQAEDATFWDRAVDTLNRWAADGWAHVPGASATGRILMRRAATDPKPFELRWIPKAELDALPADAATRRLDELAAVGWRLIGPVEDAPFLELRRPL